MSQRGFVYMLANAAMPCYYKIGTTSKSPHRRAAELSSSTGVPERFSVLCSLEVDNANEVERRLHDFLADFRPNFDREFFMFRDEHLPWVIGLFEHHPQRIAFVRRQRTYTADAVEAINPWRAGAHEPDMTSICPIAFLDVEPI